LKAPRFPDPSPKENTHVPDASTASGGSPVDRDRRALADVERKIKDVVTVIENGGYKPALLDRLDELELQRGRLRERLARVSATPPDVHPNVSEIFRAKVARLAETLNDPVDRAQAAQAIRSLIERVVLLPDPDSGEIKPTLEGELGTILEWVTQQTTNTGRTRMRGVSVSVVAWACNRLDLQLMRLLSVTLEATCSCALSTTSP
jgi:hypothetical protein